MTDTTKAKVPMSCGVDPDVPRHLDAIAKRKLRTRAYVIREALDQYIERERVGDRQAPEPERGVGAGPKTQRQRRTGR